MKGPRIIRFEDETILRIAEDGSITLEPSVTAEQLAKLLAEAMDKATFWREQAQANAEFAHELLENQFAVSSFQFPVRTEDS